MSQITESPLYATYNKTYHSKKVMHNWNHKKKLCPFVREMALQQRTTVFWLAGLFID